MSQYNQVYNWAQFSSPFQNQQQVQMSNYQANYPSGQLSGANVSPFQANRNYLDTQTYYSQGTPSYDRSFASSGYASGNSSFNSPNNYFRSYPVYNYQPAQSNSSFNDSFGNVSYQQNTLPVQIIANDSLTEVDQLAEARQRNAKRIRVDENENISNILNQVFQNGEQTNELMAPKAKRVYRKKAKLAEAEIPVLNEITNSNYSSAPVYSVNNLINDSYGQSKQSKLIENDDEFCDDFDEDEDQNDMTTTSTGEKKKRVLTRTQRVAANQRERKRMNIMNESFVQLRQALPISTGRKRRKMSRLDIVVGAMEYIAYLDELLKSTDGPVENNFQEYQNKLFMIDY